MVRSILVQLVAVCLIVLTAASNTDAAPAKSPYSITVFVEEGEPNGHIFMSLSDGKTNRTLGFYSENKKLALLGLGGGEVRDDSKTPWSVKKTYPITKEGYVNALGQVMNVLK